MATERQRRLMLGAVLVVLAALLYRAFAPAGTASDGAPASSNAGGRVARGADAAVPTAPDVHLRDLEAERPKPPENERNLFRFKPKAPPPPPPQSVSQTPLGTLPEAAGPPPPAPIPLKFIGIAEAPAQGKRIAALVDPTGHSYHGAEGEIVAGQYRILKIGVESIEMAYLDGRGRQTIRLAGS
jgi:hypothetical protein